MQPSDMIEFACQECKTRLKVKATAAGQTVACPRCKTALKIPGEKAPAAFPALAKPATRQPLGDPLPGESGDPAQRVMELTAQNRDLQEKLRRKETELELARLKLVDLTKPEPGETKPVAPEAAPVAASATPPAKGGWVLPLGVLLLVILVALAAWYAGRRSRPVPVPAAVPPPVSVPASSPPESAAPAAPAAEPAPAVTSPDPQPAGPTPTPEPQKPESGTPAPAVEQPAAPPPDVTPAAPGVAP